MTINSYIDIATDNDGVLVDYIRPFLIYHNRVYNTNFRYEDITHHDISKILGLTGKETNRRLDEFMHSPSSNHLFS